MDIIETTCPDVLLLQPRVFEDERGFFMETFRQSFFDDLGLNVQFVQENYSASERGVLRGLHYQLQKPQGKLVRVTVGEVYDVAVDLRQNSPTFSQHVGVRLSAENKQQLWVPPGFAHGFLVLSERAEFSYRCTEYYHPEDERAIVWNDSHLAIDWPDCGEKILSKKDSAAPAFSNAALYP